MTPPERGGDWSQLRKKDPEAERAKAERRANRKMMWERRKMQSDLERLRFFVWMNCDPCQFPEVPDLLDGWDPPA